MPLTTLCGALLLVCWPIPSAAAEPANSCAQCHVGQRSGFAEGHAFGAVDCTICHGGDAQAGSPDAAHADMTGFPGLLGNAAQACGSCHADKITSVGDSLMNTGHGMVDVTRRLVDGDVGDPASVNLQSLGHGPADSMLRKLCASCHLGQNKTAHTLNPVSDRGGGCLACHINEHPQNAHPRLTAEVSDARCFGCHSRSARISLSYTGLAETNKGTVTLTRSPLRLPDGRYVERKPADVHFTSGMTCTDCHKGADLMAAAGEASHQRDAVDASCGDCHGVEGADVLVHDDLHGRLECVTCHSQWVPQCFGCHMEYDAEGEQWDHIAQRQTPGRWHESRSDFRHGLGALGVNAHDRIELFTPGMIMTLAHPDWEEEKFVRAFAPISPHTIGASRSCESCHRSSVALGLGEGAIEVRDSEITFTPAQPLLQDGLPADAWTNVDGDLGGVTARPGQRPLNKKEMEAILEAPLK